MNDSLADLVTFLSTVQLWQGLEVEELERLGGIAIKQTFDKNEIIFWEGDPGTGFFVVLSGRVKLFKLSPDGKEQIFHLFSTGEHFAEVPAFDGQCFPVSAATLEATELLFFPRTDFLALLQAYPTLALNMLAICSRHLRKLTQLVETVSLKEVPARLATYLMYLSERQDTTEIELEMTKGQLAALLGTIPETLSRVFNKLTQEGIIHLKGAKIQILDVNKLETLAKK